MKEPQNPLEVPIEPSIMFVERIVVDFKKALLSEVGYPHPKETVSLMIIEFQKSLLRTVCGVIDSMKKQGARALPSFTEELATELKRIRMERR